MKKYVYAIIDEEGEIVYDAITTAPSESDAWRLFFREYPYKATLYTAIKAYQAIGYKCVKYELVLVEEDNVSS